MNEKNVPVRKMSVYQTDDGRRIEAFEKVSTVPFDTRSEEDDAINNFEQKTTIYVGAVPIMTSKGPREIKFEIENANTIEEAFAGFFPAAEKTMESLNAQQKAMEEQMQEPRIVPAPAQALKDLEGKKPGNIIIA